MMSFVPLPSKESLISLYSSSTDPNSTIANPTQKAIDVLASFQDDRKGLLLVMLVEKYGITTLLKHKVLQPQQLVVNRNSLLDLYKSQESGITPEATLKSDLDAVIELFEDDQDALLKAMETKYSPEIVLPYVCPQLKQLALQRLEAKQKKEKKSEDNSLVALYPFNANSNNNNNNFLQLPQTERHRSNSSNSNSNNGLFLVAPSPSPSVNSASNPLTPKFSPTVVLTNENGNNNIQSSSTNVVVMIQNNNNNNNADLMQSGTSHFSPSMARRLGIPKNNNNNNYNTQNRSLPTQQPQNSANKQTNDDDDEHAENDQDENDTNSDISSSDSEDDDHRHHGYGSSRSQQQQHRTNNGLTLSGSDEDDVDDETLGNDENGDGKKSNSSNKNKKNTGNSGAVSSASSNGMNANSSNMRFSRFQSMSATASRRLMTGGAREGTDIKEMLTQYFSREGMPKKTPQEIEFLAFKYADSRGELLDKLRRQYGDVALNLAGLSAGLNSTLGGTTNGGVTSSPLLSPSTNNNENTNNNAPAFATEGSSSKQLSNGKVGFSSEANNNNNSRDQSTFAAADKLKESAIVQVTLEMRQRLMKMTDEEADKFLGGDDPERRVPHFIELFASPSGRILYGYWSTMCLRIGTTGMKRLHYSLARFSPRMPAQASAALACTFENELFLDGEPASMAKRRLLRRDQQMNQMKEQVNQLLQVQRTSSRDSLENSSHALVHPSSAGGDAATAETVISSPSTPQPNATLGRSTSALSNTSSTGNNNNNSLVSPKNLLPLGGEPLPSIAKIQSTNSFNFGSFNNNSAKKNNNNNAMVFGSGIQFFEDWEQEAQQVWSTKDLDLIKDIDQISAAVLTASATTTNNLATNNNNISKNTVKNTSSGSAVAVVPPPPVLPTIFRVSTAAEVWAATVMQDILRFREEVISVVGRVLRDESRERSTIQLRSWKQQAMLSEVTQRAFSFVLMGTLPEAEERRRREIWEAEDVDYRGLTLFFFRYRDAIPEKMSSLDFLSAVVGNGNNNINNYAKNSEHSPSSQMHHQSAMNHFSMSEFYGNNLLSPPSRNSNHNNNINKKENGNKNANDEIQNKNNEMDSEDGGSPYSSASVARTRMISHFQDLSRTARIAAEQLNMQQASLAFKSKEEEARLRHLITYGEKVNPKNRDFFMNPFQTADRQAENRIGRMQALFGASSESAKKSFVRATTKAKLLARMGAISTTNNNNTNNNTNVAAVSSPPITSTSEKSKRNHENIINEKSASPNQGKYEKSLSPSAGIYKSLENENTSTINQTISPSVSPTGLTPFMSPSAKNRNERQRRKKIKINEAVSSSSANANDVFGDLLSETEKMNEKKNNHASKFFSSDDEEDEEEANEQDLHDRGTKKENDNGFFDDDDDDDDDTDDEDGSEEDAEENEDQDYFSLLPSQNEHHDAIHNFDNRRGFSSLEASGPTFVQRERTKDRQNKQVLLGAFFSGSGMKKKRAHSANQGSAAATSNSPGSLPFTSSPQGRMNNNAADDEEREALLRNL